jgi:hypothetical protein
MELVAPRGLHPTAKNSQAAAIRASIDPAILMTLSIVLRIYPKLNAERITLINVKATVPTKLHYPQPPKAKICLPYEEDGPLEPSINHVLLVTDNTTARGALGWRLEPLRASHFNSVLTEHFVDRSQRLNSSQQLAER